MKKIIVPGLVVGVVLFVIGMLLSMIFNMLIPSLQAEYQNPNMFRPWSDPLMSLFFAHPFLFGLGLAYVWDKIKGAIGGNPLNLTIGIVVISTIPGMVITYSSFPVSITMVLTWTIMGIVNAYVGGLILSKMNP